MYYSLLVFVIIMYIDYSILKKHVEIKNKYKFAISKENYCELYSLAAKV